MVPVSLAELVLSGLIRLLKITISSFQLRRSVAKWADIKEYTPPEAPIFQNINMDLNMFTVQAIKPQA